MKKEFIAIFYLVLLSPFVYAETLDLQQSIDRAMKNDPRIREKQKLVEKSEALVEEAEGANNLIYDVNFFVGIAPKSEDGPIFLEDGVPKIRTDLFNIDGLLPWYNLQATIIKPVNTFGKIENLTKAAKAKTKVEEQEVTIQKADIILDVHKAYYGHLAARDSRLLLEDVNARIKKSIDLVQKWLNDASGNAKQSDLFALQTGAALINRYYAEAKGLEGIALDGLKVLTGVGLGNKLSVSDKKLVPAKLPTASLDELQKKALKQRSEHLQLEAGLEARRALVAAKKADKKPNIYTGLTLWMAYTPGRPPYGGTFFFDPFNGSALTPILGVKWDWTSGRQPAQVKQAQADLDALVEKSAFAQQGIPFQVAEQYQQVHYYHDMVEQLAKGSRAGRRWMISSFADFEAGLEEAAKVMTAFQGYILAHTDYLKAVNEYNMHVAGLKHVTGDF